MRNLRNGETFEETFFDINSFALWFLWGIPMALYAFKALGFNIFLGKEWEDQKIKEYMNNK